MVNFKLTQLERDFRMTATSKSIAQAAALCVGLFSANMVWSGECSDDVRAKNDVKLDAAQAQPLSAAELKQLFHGAELNQTDGLGDYVHNFHPNRPHRR